jgi:DNA polymerase III alpha subunit
LQETYGIIVYQEQVMECAKIIAGYTLGGADMLRRAMGKKDAEAMAKERIKFVEGAKRVNNIDEKQGQRDLRPAQQVRELRVQQVALRRLRLVSATRRRI